MKGLSFYLFSLVCLESLSLQATEPVCISTARSDLDSCSLMKMPLGVLLGINDPCDAPRFYTSASYTLWTAHQEGMAISLANATYLNPVAVESIGFGKVLYPDFRFCSGFKGSLGAFIGEDFWDLGGEYTWFRNEGSRFSSVSSPSGFIFPTSVVNNVMPAVNKARGKWDNFFNRLDIKLGKNFYLGRSLTTKPFLGLLSAFEKQSFDISYTNSSDPFIIREGNRQKWVGVGPYLGCNSSFIWGRFEQSEWSLVFNSGCCLAFGNYRTKSSIISYLSDLDRPLSHSIFEGKNSLWNFTPMVELSLGLRLETFHSPSYKWSSIVQLAWEGQVFLSHNQMALLHLLSDGNNSSLHGGTFTLQVAF